MGERGGRAGWGWAALCAGCVIAFAVWGLSPGIELGDADPVSAVIALAGLGVTVWSAYMTWVALRSQNADVAAAAARLAVKVARAEAPERARLLGGDHIPIDLRFVLSPAPGHNAEGADPDGRLGAVVDYYRRLRPRRLVITGAPGSGKTVLALELLLALLENRDPQDPVPVRMSLASWTTLPEAAPHAGVDARVAVETWVREHLERVHGLSRAAAGALVEAGMVLPVLDGLDEMDATGTTGSAPPGGPGPGGGPRARRALATLNAYALGRARSHLVVTCRSGAYEASDVWAKSAARVEITRVTPAQVREFVLARVDDSSRWQGVLDALDIAPSGPLARGLSTPWRLTMAVTVHEQHDAAGAYVHEPRSLLSPTLNGDAAMRDHLNRLYVRAAAAHPAPGDGRGYTPEEVHTRLGVLAGYLDTNAITGRVVGGKALSGTDLVLHELWPLAGDHRARAVHTLLSLGALLPILATMGVATDEDDFTSRLFGWGLVLQWIILLLVCHRSLVWPPPTRLDPGRLRTAHGRHAALRGLTVGLVMGLSTWLMAGLVFGLAVGLVFGLAVWLGLGLDDEKTTEVGDPRDLVRADLTGGLAFGLAFGLGLGVVFGLGGGLAFGTVIGLGLGLGAGLLGAFVGIRYVAFLLCVRIGPRALPWRLGRFLHWATEAGLLRTAGIAYQFRHRELQDWLARNPTPPP
ncbi:NACHT domain-containing protein [Embleya scabrispora]|uniref:NACHT domain-containing protein n=1 Tax=Embleya scabrispora TaxID=159449 RepID=UPI00099EFC89|nr:NACHT domain-containing protein [Embleya scabrispora]MYS81612.1 NACHT domain-containing protein [Streptomyces sp. SID5474]